jgi:hypothetical protein
MQWIMKKIFSSRRGNTTELKFECCPQFHMLASTMKIPNLKSQSRAFSGENLNSYAD